ncbi:MAG: TonB-dependent receptor [Bacteroidetes bacterium]|nr:MAG: TonB-dependent receptor [Bacteroidota bacterium]
MKGVLMFLGVMMAVLGAAQTPITGRVLDKKSRPIVGASIGIKDGYDGTTSDSLGRFKFICYDKDSQTVVISAMGYKSLEQKIFLSGNPIEVNGMLKEEPNELAAVIITAGSFEASDEKKTTVLKPLDIVTTASANADVAAALRTLPGTQQVGESAELFVRGGAGYETRQFIDGTTVANPFFGQAPDIASRGRFSPFLFKGTVFSTGGYSALYGQALSSALILESIDLPEQTTASANVSGLFVGGQYQHLAKDKKSSWGASGGYTNLGVYFKLIKQRPDFFDAPKVYNADVNFRKKTSKTGMLKFYGAYAGNKLGLRNPDIDDASLKNSFSLNNHNLYTNMSYKERLANRLKLNAGFSVSLNKDDLFQQLQNQDNKPVTGTLPQELAAKNFGVKNTNLLAQMRAVLEYKLRGLSAVRGGAEYWYSSDEVRFNNRFTNTLNDNFASVFAEADLYVTNDLAAKLGARAEHSSLLSQWNMAPRMSLAYKLNKRSQISADYGIFYQKPLNQYLIFKRDLPYMQANHYILTFQKMTVLNTFRAQVFNKDYRQLTRFGPDTTGGGRGYARGVEFFWRDKKSLKDFDYWITYSFLDTKRQYLNFPYEMTPNFAAKHTANVVIKRYFTKLKTQLNLNYQFATGRPYYNIRYNSSQSKWMVEDEGRTISFNNLSFSANYLTTVGKAFTVFVFSITNVLNTKQVFGYNYSFDGQVKQPILPPARQFVFVGAFLSWGQDRRQDAINNNL